MRTGPLYIEYDGAGTLEHIIEELQSLIISCAQTYEVRSERDLGRNGS